MPKRILQGEIVSNKMNETVVVKVKEVKFNSKYSRYYDSHKKYKAHAVGAGNFLIGQKVSIQECVPKSKDKKWEVITK